MIYLFIVEMLFSITPFSVQLRHILIHTNVIKHIKHWYDICWCGHAWVCVHVTKLGFLSQFMTLLAAQFTSHFSTIDREDIDSLNSDHITFGCTAHKLYQDQK
eukprot:567385_1